MLSAQTASAEILSDRYQGVRDTTLSLIADLRPEDTVVQTMPDVSPTKWHLAHVTWFFERFVLEPYLQGYSRFDDQYHYLFNSYYNSAGDMHARPKRGLLSRPVLADVLEYRAVVDAAMHELLLAQDVQRIVGQRGRRRGGAGGVLARSSGRARQAERCVHGRHAANGKTVAPMPVRHAIGVAHNAWQGRNVGHLIKDPLVHGLDELLCGIDTGRHTHAWLVRSRNFPDGITDLDDVCGNGHARHPRNKNSRRVLT